MKKPGIIDVSAQMREKSHATLLLLQNHIFEVEEVHTQHSAYQALFAFDFSFATAYSVSSKSRKALSCLERIG